MSKNSFFRKNHMFGMPVCSQKCKNWYVSCSFMILQYKISQRNLTAIKLSQYYYAYRLHTFFKNVTNINFLSRPGPNVPYIYNPSRLFAIFLRLRINVNQKLKHAAFSKFKCSSFACHAFLLMFTEFIFQ